MPTTTLTPNAQEQLLLELTNRARMSPEAEFDALIANATTGTGVQANITSALSYFGVDLTALRSQFDALTSVAPLAWNSTLASVAEAHTQLLLDFNEQTHEFPGGSKPGERVSAAGYDWTSIGENVFSYAEDMLYGHAGFFIDWGEDESDFVNGTLRSDWQINGDGIQDRAGHRNTIMNLGYNDAGVLVVVPFTEIGIAVIEGTGVLQPGQPAGTPIVGPYLITQNFGNRADYQAQLLGVVIDDRDGDRFYDIGEGLGGITVTATGTGGTFTTQSWSSGGYQMVLPNGSYTISFSGGGLTGAASYTATMGGANVKLDAFAADFVVVNPPRDLTGTALGDLLEGGSGNDRLRGMEGSDTLRGFDGTDTLEGGTGDDFLFGGSSTADLRDVMFGGDGHDSMDGGWGNDELNGGEGNDTILGDFGSDTLIGNAGDDLISGGAGSDLMFGGPGNDTLNGGWGYDRMNGGTGADRFFHAGVADHASDWIQDYNAADGDVLVFGLAGATRAQFQVNVTTTPGAGSGDVAEAFVIYRPTGQIMWALVDGDAQSSINLLVGGQVYDLLA